MDAVFELWHYKVKRGQPPDQTDLRQDAKDLGIYSSESNARAATERRRDDPGFRDWPDGFRIERVSVDPTNQSQTGSKSDRVFQVWHFRIGSDDEADTEELQQRPNQLGTYRSEQSARLAVERFRQDRGFEDFPGGFRIFPRRLDVDHWQGGFVPWDEA
jgi:hypothetical protein